MELLQHTQLDSGGAARFTYYALTTGFDIHPGNGSVAKAAFKRVRQIISERAVIQDDISVRIFTNDDIFHLPNFSAAANNIEVCQYLFSVLTHNNGWTSETLSKELMRAAPGPAQRGPEGTYSIKWLDSKIAGMSAYIPDVSTGAWVKIEGRQLRMSSDVPLLNEGRTGDWWFVIRDGVCAFWYKDSKRWNDISSKLIVDINEPTFDPLKYWFNPTGLVLQYVPVGRYWDISDISAEINSVDVLKLRLIFEEGVIRFEHNKYNTWQKAHLNSFIVRNTTSWFSAEGVNGNPGAEGEDPMHDVARRLLDNMGEEVTVENGKVQVSHGTKKTTIHERHKCSNIEHDVE